MGKAQLKYNHHQLESRLTVLIILGFLSVCCMNIFSLVTVPCAFLGLRLLKNGDWENIHRDEIRQLSNKIKDMKANPPRDYSMDREQYFKKVGYLYDNEEKWESWERYRSDSLKHYEKTLKAHKKETEKLEKQLENMRSEKMPESVLKNYIHAQRLATVALVFLIIPIVIIAVIELFGLDNWLMRVYMDLT